LGIKVHKLTFRVKLSCPRGDSHRVLVDVTARNDKNEITRKPNRVWRVDCV
jgi:hypothetical protein